MTVHFCPLDKQCRELDLPARLHVSTKRWRLIVALTPKAKVLNRPWGDPRCRPVWFRFTTTGES